VQTDIDPRNLIGRKAFDLTAPRSARRRGSTRRRDRRARVGGHTHGCSSGTPSCPWSRANSSRHSARPFERSLIKDPPTSASAATSHRSRTPSLPPLPGSTWPPPPLPDRDFASCRLGRHLKRLALRIGGSRATSGRARPAPARGRRFGNVRTRPVPILGRLEPHRTRPRPCPATHRARLGVRTSCPAGQRAPPAPPPPRSSSVCSSSRLSASSPAPARQSSWVVGKP